MPLNDIAIKNAKPKEKKYRIRDTDNLLLEIYPSGVKGWRVRYRVNEKNRENCLGNYPAISLKEARKQRDEINEMLAAGLDPLEEKALEKQSAQLAGMTFQEAFDKWLAAQTSPSWAGERGEKQIVRIHKHLIHPLGHVHLAKITPASVLTIVKELESQKYYNTSRWILSVASRIMRFSVVNGWVDSAPCRDLIGALAPITINHHAAIIDPLTAGKLLLDIDAYTGTGVVRCALQLLPLVFLRTNELRKAEWQEINFAEKEWRIPATRMKMRDAHVVPLCRQAMAILEELHEVTGSRQFVFPSLRTKTQCMSNGTILAALKRMGYSGDEMTTGHGFRTLASTTLNEHSKNGDHIERQLAHAPRDQVRAAYNRASYLEERREMMQWWGNYLDELRAKRREYEQARRARI